ncbi:DUF1508 domain-containing protein [Flavobacterium sp. XGLA_31]|uniref:DUF1508 domain-containing protein n=1 Tax=Flavobacterium sp. XGLA_31 TaxID=3447666 RepID=UPI003F30AE12
MAIVKLYQDNKKEWRIQIKSDNGKIIFASSEGYINQSDCVANLVSVSHITTDIVLRGFENLVKNHYDTL